LAKLIARTQHNKKKVTKEKNTIAWLIAYWQRQSVDWIQSQTWQLNFSAG